LEKEVRDAKMRGGKDNLSALVNSAVSLPSKQNGGIKVVSSEVESSDVEGLRETADHVRDKINGIVILAAGTDEKTSFVVTITPALKEAGFHAGKIAKAFAEKIGGSGGGRELFAQGGGKSVPNLKEILESFPKEIKES
jgi:alanyl-tRNA synthetase